MTIGRRVLAAVAAAGIAIATSLGMAAPAMAAATVSPTVLTTGYYATQAAYNPAGTMVAVGTMGDGVTIPAEVDLIDVKTNTVSVILDGDITTAVGVAWSPDGTTIYVTNYDGNLVKIDVATKSVVNTIATGLNNPQAVAVSPDGSSIWVGSYGNGNVAVVDAASFSVSTTLTGFSDATNVGLFFSPDGGTAYAVGYFGGVDYVSTTSNTIFDTKSFQNMGYGGMSVCQSFDGATLFMADYNEGVGNTTYVSRLNLATGDSISQLAPIDESQTCGMTPDGKHVLFGGYGSENPTQVVEVDGTTLDYVTAYDTSVADNSDAIASSSKNCDVYVANFYQTTNILNFTCGLPDTGASQSLVITLASVGGGLVIVGIVAMILVRRRKTHE